MRSKLCAILVLAGGLLAANSVFAHHSRAPYDSQNPITVSGTVTEYEFANPHVKISFVVKDEKGGATNWIAEVAPVAKMYRAGWSRVSLKPGDSITVTGHPLKDGRKVIHATKVVAPNLPVLSDTGD